jgi:hypothetical protein
MQSTIPLDVNNNRMPTIACKGMATSARQSHDKQSNHGCQLYQPVSSHLSVHTARKQLQNLEPQAAQTLKQKPLQLQS